MNRKYKNQLISREERRLAAESGQYHRYEDIKDIWYPEQIEEPGIAYPKNNKMSSNEFYATYRPAKR